jgi:hypothetical protein
MFIPFSSRFVSWRIDLNLADALSSSPLDIVHTIHAIIADSGTVSNGTAAQRR